MAIQFKYPVEINAASGTSGAALSLTNNSAGSSAGPIFNLYRDSASPANFDSTGQLSFQANNSVGSKREYVRIAGSIGNVANGGEDGRLSIQLMINGSLSEKIRFTDSATLHYTLNDFDDITINGYLEDGGGSTGSAGQVLSSTGSVTEWITLASNTDNYVDSVSFTKSSSTLSVGRTGALSTFNTVLKSLTGDVVSNLDTPTNSSSALMYYDRFSNGPTGDIPGSTNNANGILTMFSHSGPYGKQIGFGDNDEMYIRKFSNNVMGTWRRLAWEGNLGDSIANESNGNTILDIVGLDGNGDLTNRTPAQFISTNNITQFDTGTLDNRHFLLYDSATGKARTSILKVNSLEQVVDVNGTVQADGYATSTGTSSQFLKADGTVDSNTYVTTNTNQNITGTKTFTTGALKLEGASYSSGTDTVTNSAGIQEKGSYLYGDDGTYLRKLIGWATDGKLEVGQGGTSLITQINLQPGNAGNSGVKVNGNTVWNAGNDGSGSTLDADLLDGQHGAYYLDYDNFTNTPTIPSTTNLVTTNTTQTISGAKTFTGTTKFHGETEILAGNNDPKLRFKRTTSSGAGDDIVDITMQDNGLDFIIDNDSEGDVADYKFKRITGGVKEDILVFSPTVINYKGNKIFHAGNDGSGSGLDADLLDGLHGSSYVKTSTNQNVAGQKTFTDDVFVTDALKFEVSTSDVANQRADARDDGTEAILHWYGQNTSASAKAMKHNWYDGSSYIEVRPSGSNVAFTRQSGTCSLSASGTMTATNFILSSDKNLKKNIEDLKPEEIKVDWKTYELKGNEGQKRYGVIAQDLLETNPEFVRQNEETKEYSVAYVDLLVAKVAELENRLSKIESIIDKL